MLIQLRQSEIEAALRDYIVNQGISLIGRTVEISFTSGRKDNGILADLDILEAGPTAGYRPLAAIAATPYVVSKAEEPQGVEEEAVVIPFTPVKEAEVVEEDTPLEPVEAPVKASASLFG